MRAAAGGKVVVGRAAEGQRSSIMINFIHTKQGYAAKPQGAAVAALQKPSAYNFHSDCSIEDIANIIGTGRAWRAGLYSPDTDSFKKAKVAAAIILALDFDGSTKEPQAVIDYAASIGLLPSLWYYSYSQGIKAGHNFRVLWVLAEPIKPIYYENIYKNLLEAFADFNPDVSTKDASRLWYGTRQQPTVINNKPIPLSTIGWLGVCKKLEEGQPVQKAKKAVKCCEKDYFEAADSGSIEPFYITQRRRWWEELRVRCWLWDRWERGEYLNYNQRLTLFTNLKYLKYTDTNFSIVADVLEVFEKHKSVYAGHTCDETQIRGMFLNTTLHAMGIVKVEGSDEPITVKEFFERGEREVINTIEKVSLKELDRLLDERFPVLLDDDGIVYIKAQTACGKTHRVIHWLLKQDLTQKKIVYSAPRYTNISEFEERFTAAQAAEGQQAGSNVCVVPQGQYSPTDLLLMEMGFPAHTKQDERFHAIRKLVNPDEKGLFICSHQLLAHLRTCPADCIIIDENIEEALLDVVIMDKGGIGGLIPYIRNKDKQIAVLNLINTLKDKERGEIVDITALQDAVEDFDWNGYINTKKPMSGVAKLLDRNMEPPRISRQKGDNAIRFATRSTLISEAIEKNIPIKMLSATPKSARLSAMYDTDKIRVEVFPLAENKGKIIQYEGMTGSKGKDCGNVGELISYVVEKVPEDERQRAKVLSFKDAIPYWEDAGFQIAEYNGTKLHIANNAGLDLLKGQIVIVAGKFDDNDDKYLDIFYDIHPQATKPPQRKNQLIRINGRLKNLFLWDDEDLRALQIENIQLYLEQSAGRARALREAGAIVYLFANFPIADADRYYDE